MSPIRPSGSSWVQVTSRNKPPLPKRMHFCENPGAVSLEKQSVATEIKGSFSDPP